MAKNSFVAEVTLKWANKKCKNFNIYNVVFLKKLRKTRVIIILQPCTKNLDDHFFQKIRILKKRKKLLGISFYTSLPKTTII